MNNYRAYYDAIDEIYSYLKRDLIGPVDELEVLENVEPLSTYACGILWPQRTDTQTAEVDEPEEAKIAIQQEYVEEVEDTVSAADDSISNANVYKPTSMGISLMLANNTQVLSISFSGAKYSHEDEQIENRLAHRYKRVPFSVEAEAKVGEQLGTQRVVTNTDLGFEITITLRSILDDGSRLVTITVQNILRARQKGIDQSISALFQCELAVTSDTALLPLYQNNALISDIEESISRLQYRNMFNFAYGHGCSISYSEMSDGVFLVKSDFMPVEWVYQMMPDEISSRDILNLAYWKTVARDIACAELSNFVEEYANWYERQTKIAKTFHNGEYVAASKAVLGRISECISRLKRGIEVLNAKDKAWEAFVLMNKAMLLQRIKTKHTEEQAVNWYPFQIAYILQVVPDIVDESSSYRESVDLLWFPTGGGKTEAYLGVAAFTIFYRRLTGMALSDGVTVIMRYTLRLLTIQQFERATALICACEHIRKQENIAGGEINIGLWIGSSMTPNRIEQAKTVLDKLRENPYEKIYEGNPVQITKCPWCGKKIDLNGYEIRGGTLNIRCADNADCEFHNGLPVYVVDDDIYRVRPTLLLSTIDKFARIAWEENTRNLFGEQCPPPELIIQDELHLISGPLGSLSGIYEIALEYLCGNNGKRPKIIASTATVKNAKEQIRNLYNRKTIQFPPAGISFDDSFFAVRADETQRPARTYIGLCEMGGSSADLLIRVYATLFFTKALFIKQNKDSDIIDQYFTTVGYFNALRDLGASSTIIQDRIFTHIRNLVARTFRRESEQYQITPADVRVFEHSELTSRKSSKEIKDTLDQLTLRYSESGSYSYVLASNMLSVGIDIDRLGVMTVYNQPKSNAEYIQATSRVGRRNPGIVLAMYNNMRSRDKSHYEQFGYYHKSFYRYVEATSVTPFSLRAIEKALHCIFVSMIRLTIPFLSANESARDFQADLDEVTEIRDYIVKRVKEIMPKHENFAAETLRNFARDWEDVASENSNTLCYKSYNGLPSLLSSAEEDSKLGLPKILNSLRNVDPTVNIFFRR
ncbi:MAG TPA: hypothetical protein DER33_08650 [Syntrophomonas sp.]|jgi:hypothetical protein|nr:hypothetical protein [Syntrophomonas sp.]